MSAVFKLQFYNVISIFDNKIRFGSLLLHMTNTIFMVKRKQLLIREKKSLKNVFSHIFLKNKNDTFIIIRKKETI